MMVMIMLVVMNTIKTRSSWRKQSLFLFYTISTVLDIILKTESRYLPWFLTHYMLLPHAFIVIISAFGCAWWSLRQVNFRPIPTFNLCLISSLKNEVQFRNIESTKLSWLFGIWGDIWLFDHHYERPCSCTLKSESSDLLITFNVLRWWCCATLL